MGCGASRVRPDPALVEAALRFGQQFELTTPMLVMPFAIFKAQGRIMKSTKAWRDEALAEGSLVAHEEGSGKIVIFISHTWWDRSFKDATNDPNNPYDLANGRAQGPEVARDLRGRAAAARAGGAQGGGGEPVGRLAEHLPGRRG